QSATRKCAIQLAFMSARCSRRREFHLNWSCKHAGLPEISASILSPPPEMKSRSFSSALGTAKQDRIFVTLQFGSMTTSRLEAAAQFRLRQKANRIRNKVDTHGRDETLFQEIASALGYKENKLPFTLLAQRFPLRLLRENIQNCEAMLFGGAGFLDTSDLDIYKK